MTAPTRSQREAASRRRFLAAAGTAAAVPAAAALIGVGPLAGAARAATPGGLPDYAPIPPGALGKLAAADVFTADNAYVMFEALRVEYGMLGPFGDHA